MRPDSAGAGDATSIDLAIDGYKPATTARAGGGEEDDVWEHRIRKAGRTLNPNPNPKPNPNLSPNPNPNPSPNPALRRGSQRA